MTSFQKKVLDLVKPLLSEHSIEAEFEKSGVRDSHLHLHHCGKVLDIWIYDDEVAFKRGDYHLQCERPDFDGPEEMVEFFMAKLADSLDEKCGGA